MEGGENTADGGGGDRGEPDITLSSEGIVNQIGTRGRGRRKRKKTLKWGTINAQDLRNKMVLLEERVKEHGLKIVGVTESWGKERINDSHFNLNKFNMYRADREDKEGGGALLYISSDIEQRFCRPLNTGGYKSSTWCWIIEKGGKKILVGSVYRSTDSTKENDALLLKKIEQANEIAGDNRLLILGDFNVPKIDWKEKDLKRGARKIERDMLDVVNDCFLYQHVKVDTRFRNENSSNLDLAFTKEDRDVRNIEIKPPLGSSDHAVVIGDVVTQWKSRVVQKPRRLYHKGNYTKIIEELDLVDWDEKFVNKSVQEAWDIFKDILKTLIEKYIPMSTPNDYNDPWMNPALMRYWKKKYHAWMRYTESKSYQRHQVYKRKADLFKKKARQAKRLYEKRLAKGVRHNKRAFFRYVNSKLTVRPEITEMKNEYGRLIDSDEGITSIMVKYFSSVHTATSNDEMPEMNPMYEREISNLEIKREDIQSRLEKLKVNKSCGPDNMNPYVLQKTASAVSVPLEKIFKQSLSTGICPSDWRSANVTPIHKKGDRTEPSNYRPVSLTSQVCKVLESIVRKHILEHLVTNNILSDRQHGFREGRSCLTNLLEIMESWTEILDEDDGIDVAYLDFRKAFDLVSHRHLIYKMSKYGITDQTLNWVTAFLSDRTQRVVIRGTASEPCNVTSGVPQGSVLGPILFLIYINDLPLGVISPLSLFADDSKIFTRITSEKNVGKTDTNTNGKDTLQGDLNNIKAWANKWKMEFNVDKCKIMHLGRLNPGHKYTMGNTELTETTEEKDLGVLVDNELHFGKHIKGIVNKANRMLGMIKIGFACLDKEIFLYLYPVLVRPLLEYCVQVWSPYKQMYIDLIERVQKRATKLVPGLRRKTYDERLKKLGLTRLVERRFRGDMIETFKILTKKVDVKTETFFQMRSERGDPELFRGKKIFKKRSRKLPRRNVFSQRVVNPWNKLTREEVQSLKTSSFKSHFDKKEVSRKEARQGSGERAYKLLYCMA